MKTLLKWNLLLVLFMTAFSLPLLTACGGDDDEPNEEDIPGGQYIGWKKNGNTATFGFKMSEAGVSATGVYTLTFDGSGDDALCTKCILVETFSVEEVAKYAEAEWKEMMSDPENGIKSVKRDGKKVTVDNNDFVGQKCGNIKKALELIYPPK